MKKKFLATAVSVALLATGCASKTESEEENPFMPISVRYEVETSDGRTIPSGKQMTSSITVTTPDGTEQATVNLPLKMKDGDVGYTQAFMPGSFVSISAQKGDYYGSITCRIVASDLDGGDERVLSENTSSGSYAIASCSGTAR